MKQFIEAINHLINSIGTENFRYIRNDKYILKVGTLNIF